MPLYEYVCQDCKRKTEVLQRMKERPLRICPHCGGKLRKAFSAPAIQFKGSGFYTTDYARGTNAGKSGRAPEGGSGVKPSGVEPRRAGLGVEARRVEEGETGPGEDGLEKGIEEEPLTARRSARGVEPAPSAHQLAARPDAASTASLVPRSALRSRGVSLLPRFARDTTHAASYWAIVGQQGLSRGLIAGTGR